MLLRYNMKNELTDFKEYLFKSMRVKKNIVPYYLKRINSCACSEL